MRPRLPARRGLQRPPGQAPGDDQYSPAPGNRSPGHRPERGTDDRRARYRPDPEPRPRGARRRGAHGTRLHPRADHRTARPRRHLRGPPLPRSTIDTGTDKLLAEIAGHVATVTFNNPAKLNALSHDMRAALPDLLKTLNADADVRVIVVTGAGDRAFASGADISEFGDQRTTPEARAAYDRGQ